MDTTLDNEKIFKEYKTSGEFAFITKIKKPEIKKYTMRSAVALVAEVEYEARNFKMDGKLYLSGTVEELKEVLQEIKKNKICKVLGKVRRWKQYGMNTLVDIRLESLNREIKIASRKS